MNGGYLYSTPLFSITKHPSVIIPQLSIVSGISILPSIRPSYLDLNKDKKTTNRLTNYYLYKTLDKWLWKDLKDIMDYFVIKDGIVSVVDNPVKQQTLTESEYEKKIDYVENNLLSFKRMHKLLKHLIKRENIDWITLPKNEYLIKKEVSAYLKQQIEKKENKKIEK
jgi:hypothetical protein